jgi:hypothetical protein
MPVLSESVRLPTNSFWMSIRFCDEPKEAAASIEVCSMPSMALSALAGWFTTSMVFSPERPPVPRVVPTEIAADWLVLLATVSAPDPSVRVKSLSERPFSVSEFFRPDTSESAVSPSCTT